MKKVLLKKYNINKFAVSEVFGTLVILMISVSLFSIVYVLALTMPPLPQTNSADIYLSYNGTKIFLTHSGGNELNLNIKINIKIDSEPLFNGTVQNGLDAEAIENNLWGFGEQFVYDAGYEILNHHVEVIIIDEESNSIIFIGNLNV
jgi:hypothetical protein